MGARISGTGSFLPEKRVTNAELSTIVDTSDEWIVKRTGIKARHLLDADQLPSDMGKIAGERALEASGLTGAEIDLLIVATNFPDMICPGSAPFIAEGLNLRNAPFFDLKGGCTGFVYAIAVADGLIRAGSFNRILIIGLEALSRVTDWSDRRTCVLFGDGAGAVVLEPGGKGEGILSSALFADPEKTLLLHMPAGGTRTPPTQETIEAHEHFVKMEGSGVFKSAAPMMEEATLAALQEAGLDLEDVDWLIPHQANLRIIRSLIHRLDFPSDRVIVNLDRVANTSTASIPIALDEAIRSGRIKPGEIVLMTAFGAGVTYGSAVIRT